MEGVGGRERKEEKEKDAGREKSKEWESPLVGKRTPGRMHERKFKMEHPKPRRHSSLHQTLPYRHPSMALFTCYKPPPPFFFPAPPRRHVSTSSHLHTKPPKQEANTVAQHYQQRCRLTR